MSAAQRPLDRGFTLPELLVVIAIIGVLAGISIPVITSQAERSRQAQAQTEAAGIARMIEADLNDGFLLSGDFLTGQSSYVSKAGYGHARVSDGSTFSVQVAAEEQTYCVTVENEDGYVVTHGDCTSVTVLLAGGETAVDLDGPSAPFPPGAGARYSSQLLSNPAAPDSGYPYLMRILAVDGTPPSPLVVPGTYTFTTRFAVADSLSRGLLLGLSQKWLPNWGIQAWVNVSPGCNALVEYYRFEYVSRPLETLGPVNLAGLRDLGSAVRIAPGANGVTVDSPLPE